MKPDTEQVYDRIVVDTFIRDNSILPRSEEVVKSAVYVDDDTAFVIFEQRFGVTERRGRMRNVMLERSSDWENKLRIVQETITQAPMPIRGDSHTAPVTTTNTRENVPSIRPMTDYEKGLRRGIELTQLAPMMADFYHVGIRIVVVSTTGKLITPDELNERIEDPAARLSSWLWNHANESQAQSFADDLRSWFPEYIVEVCEVAL